MGRRREWTHGGVTAATRPPLCVAVPSHGLATAAGGAGSCQDAQGVGTQELCPLVVGGPAGTDMRHGWLPPAVVEAV